MNSAGNPPLPGVAVVEPVERRERHDAGVEPHVAGLLHAEALRLARRTRQDDVVQPRPVQPRQLPQPAYRALAQLLLASDDEEVAVRAVVERKRQTPVALAADIPVAHVV